MYCSGLTKHFPIGLKWHNCECKTMPKYMRNQRTMAPYLKNNKTLQFKKVIKPQTRILNKTVTAIVSILIINQKVSITFDSFDF